MSERRLRTPQPGVLALGTTDHAYLELDLRGATPEALMAAVGALNADRGATAGTNVVVGFRPDLWRTIAPQACPAELHGFDEPVVGADGFTMPATQHDLVVWVAGGSYSAVFDQARRVVEGLADVADLVEDVRGWAYDQNRDLTGFIDGTENPGLTKVAGYAVVGEDSAGAGGSVLLLQRWPHDTAAWTALPVTEQERVMGRTKADSVELTDKSPTSHVARTDQDDVGHIFRRNMPYGTTTDHGTMFVGLCHEQGPLHLMLLRMAGVGDEPRDDLTRYSSAETGAYYFLPAQEDLPLS